MRKRERNGDIAAGGKKRNKCHNHAHVDNTLHVRYNNINMSS